MTEANRDRMELIQEVESDQTRSRRVPVDRLNEFSGSLQRLMEGRDPAVLPFVRPEGSDQNVDLDEVRNVAFAALVIGEMPSAEYLEKHFELLGAYQGHIVALRNIDAMQAPDSAAVWSLGDPGRSVTLIHERYGVPAEEIPNNETGITVVVTRPLTPAEQNYEDATHIRLSYTMDRDWGEPGALAGVRVKRAFGVVEDGAFMAFDLEDVEPGEWPETELEDCKPTGFDAASDEEFATEAEIRTAQNLMGELSRAAA